MVSKTAILKELQKRKAEAEKPKFIFEDYCFDKQVKFLRGKGRRFRTAVCSRRAGKCREINTLVKTPTGSRKIQDLKPGDKVYGYDNDGQVRICSVTHLHDQGIKEVVDLIWNRQVVATSTLDHRWLAHNTYKGKREVKRLKDFNSRDKIAEEYVPIPGGNKKVEEAYAIGALLGDGCSRESGITISGAEKQIINKVAHQLKGEVRKYSENNYNWYIKGLKHTDPQLNFYNRWCRNRYAHEKTFDLEEVRTWTRKSQLELLAGLIDTDGSVCKTKDGRLHIRLSMQAKTVIYNCQMLILDLFQYKPIIKIDDREKYVNGPVYEISISNNKYAKRILKELPTISKTKQWKEEYSNLNERNTNPKFTGVTLGKPRKAQCYDITIDNDSHLFLDANGLIGHNTVAIAADMIDTCLYNKEVYCLYLTLTAETAREIIWSDILLIIEKYDLDCKTNQVRMSVDFPNGSKIRIAGVKDRTQIEKYRGRKVVKAYIDECQSFRPFIAELIKDILVPTLRDNRGSLYLTGTPGPVLAGPFYEYSTSDNWDNHHWTAFDNPHMHDPPEKDLEETLEEERILFNINTSDPGYQRETYGVWVEDLDSLVFKFRRGYNECKELPEEGEWTFIFGIDIGFNDSDAIAVLGYNNHLKKVYLVEELVTAKQDITALVVQIKTLQNKYNPVKMVIDAGALGKKIQEEIHKRHSLNLVAAEKSRKIEFIELMNDDLRKGRLLATEGSIFAEDCLLVQWDRDSIVKNPENPKISRTYHSDICDAVLYAWRECQHYLSELPGKPDPKRGTAAYMEKMEQEEAERMERLAKDPNYALTLELEKDIDELSSLLDDPFNDF